MNIYIVTRQDYHYKGEDYESFVCAAETENDAKMLHPEDFRMELDERGFFKPAPTAGCKCNLAMDYWAKKPESISVELVGVTSKNYDVEQVILASKE